MHMRPVWRHCFSSALRGTAAPLHHILNISSRQSIITSTSVATVSTFCTLRCQETYTVHTIQYHIYFDSSAVFEPAFATPSRGSPLCTMSRSVMQRGCDFNALHVLGRESCLVVQVPVTRCACVPLGVAASLPDENRFSRSFLTDGSPWACLGLAFRVLKLNPV